jgi:hypothetical protein
MPARYLMPAFIRQPVQEARVDEVGVKDESFLEFPSPGLPISSALLVCAYIVQP